ncbi:tetratricopeptide repeat protein [Undibacterium sp. CY18W]|uniref:Tetratricopeptide repeat protein n=1 Tax=Undibacterium hunanense TaxID=2762292 RepID=A0ABR6ZYA2_9BURK|nr:tetratricopeptide repeat protein [Undibacterium hunanense]MBC3920624.1 tetratricopeptide repeat protein [Undibacterium hunanense]
MGQQGTDSTGDAKHANDAAQAALSAEKTLNGVTADVSLPEDKLPEVALSEELFYKIITAEIAYQRGSWQGAYVTLYSVAQQTRDPRVARRAAEIALSAKQAGEALAAIRLWREFAPNSNEATQYYLGFMVMNNNLAEIQSVFTEKLKTADPKMHGILMLQAQRLLSRARDKNAAFDVLEEILSPYKNSPDAHLALAQGAYTKGDNKRAVSEAQIVLDTKTDSQLAILTIAQASSQQDAAKAMTAFLQKNPTARDVRLAYASILIDLKQLDKATKEFEQIARDRPDDNNATYTLGVLFMERNQPAEAEKYFVQYLKTLEARPGEERDPTNALVNLARIAGERKDYKAAQDWLSQVESFDGRNTAWFNVQMRRAFLYAKEGKLDDARQFLRTVKASNEAEQTQLVQTEAQLLKDAGQPDQAKAILQEGIQQQPNNPDLLYDFAMLAEAQKDISSMETSLRKVIELAPNSQHAYNALGYSFADRNIRLDEASTLIEKANQLAPDDPFILDSLGWVKFRLAKYDEAEQALRRAYELRPDAEIAVHLGELLWTMGQKDDAKKIWRDAQKKDPENQTLKTTLDRLKVKP